MGKNSHYKKDPSENPAGMPTFDFSDDVQQLYQGGNKLFVTDDEILELAKSEIDVDQEDLEDSGSSYRDTSETYKSRYDTETEGLLMNANRKARRVEGLLAVLVGSLKRLYRNLLRVEAEEMGLAIRKVLGSVLCMVVAFFLMGVIVTAGFWESTRIYTSIILNVPIDKKFAAMIAVLVSSLAILIVSLLIHPRNYWNWLVFALLSLLCFLVSNLVTDFAGNLLLKCKQEESGSNCSETLGDLAFMLETFFTIILASVGGGLAKFFAGILLNETEHQTLDLRLEKSAREYAVCSTLITDCKATLSAIDCLSSIRAHGWNSLNDRLKFKYFKKVK